MHHLVSIARPDSPDAQEVLVDQLWVRGAVGVEELATSIRAAFTDPGAATAVAAEHGTTVDQVEDTRGLDDWREHASGYTAGTFAVRPPWLPSLGTGTDLVIDPGHAFGSGSHATTRLCLTALADHVRAGDRVLDVGTGSGVLAVGAALLGATIVAIDNDPAAEAAVRANAAANGVADRIEVLIADIADIERVESDVVLLNVTIDIHELVAATVASIDADRLIVAGVLAGEQASRTATLHGRTPSHELIDGEWAALVFDHGRAARPS